MPGIGDLEHVLILSHHVRRSRRKGSPRRRRLSAVGSVNIRMWPFTPIPAQWPPLARPSGRYCPWASLHALPQTDGRLDSLGPARSCDAPTGGWRRAIMIFTRCLEGRWLTCHARHLDRRRCSLGFGVLLKCKIRVTRASIQHRVAYLLISLRSAPLAFCGLQGWMNCCMAFSLGRGTELINCRTTCNV